MMKSYPGDDKARELVAAENWAEAKELLETVTEVFEGAGPNNDLALVLARTGERDRAFDLIEEAESKPDADIRVKVNRYFLSQLCEFSDSRGEDAAKRVIDLTRGDASLKPKLSIIMRTYNRPDLITEAVRSVLRQKLSDWELVIVNDGGDREVDKVVERIWDKRMVYAYAIHSGPAGAFNVGLRLARGAYISFLDDDDLVYPEHYHRVISHLEVNPEVKAIYTDLKLVWLNRESGAVVGEEARLAGPYQPARLLGGFFIMNLLTMVLRRECLEKVPGFLEDLRSAVDWEFMIALSKHFNFEYLPGEGGELRYHEGLFQVGKRSVLDKNFQRNLIMYYWGNSPFYSWSPAQSRLREKFFVELQRFLDKRPALIAGLELRKLFKEPEYSLFYQLGLELAREERKREALDAYLCALSLAPYEFKVWGGILKARLF